ncbi:hypothetical protein Bbelb_215600 [Branchiostoma belcheri]|nr:hypothetical protein Bbelb_215600 [Branchiostoma belcheri]
MAAWSWGGQNFHKLFRIRRLLLSKPKYQERPPTSCVLRVCQLCKCSCPDEMTLVISGQTDWSRPDDLKTQEEYQMTLWMILAPRPDCSRRKDQTFVGRSHPECVKEDGEV